MSYNNEISRPELTTLEAEVPHRIVVTVDGPAGVGKTTTAGSLAARLGFLLLDSGALYRVVALHLMRNAILPGLTPVPDSTLKSMDLRMELEVGSMRIYLGSEDVTGVIREERIGEAASVFSGRTEVRRVLLDLQRSASSKWNLVAEGRDMGTVVFPHAQVKFFLTADLEERSRRRYFELLDRGEHPELAIVKEEMLSRDNRDECRSEAPLLKASDAVCIDTTHLGPEQVLRCMMNNIEEKLQVKFSNP